MAILKKLAQQKWLWLLLVILALAAFFRFYNLTAVPPGLYPDVAINGNDALQALKTGDFKLFYPENNGREGLFINLIALSFWLFGASIFAIKVVPAIFGLLTVLGLYFLTKQLFAYLASRHAEIIALLATFFIAISFWHVNFSRLGFRAITVPFFLVWSFSFLLKGLAAAKEPGSNSFIYWPLAGLFFGLGFHTYIAFRVAPVILLVPIIFSLIGYWSKQKDLWRSKFSFWSLWSLLFLTILLVALPMAIYFWQHPADFMSRTGQISALASNNPVQTILTSTVKSLGMFNVWGDCNWRHNYACQPELFWPIGILFLIGFIISLLKICRPANYKRENLGSLQSHWLLLVWFGAMLLPEIMTNEGLPHSLRSIGAIPPVFIWTGLGGWWLGQKIKALIAKNNYASVSKNGLTIFFLICLLFLSLAEFYRYFIDWGQRSEVRDAFTQRLVDEANYLKSLPANVQKFVLANENGVAVPYPKGLPMPAQTIMFLTHSTPNIKYFVEDKNSSAMITSGEPLVILPMRPDEQVFNNLAKILLGGQIERFKDFKVFKINFK